MELTTQSFIQRGGGGGYNFPPPHSFQRLTLYGSVKPLPFLNVLNIYTSPHHMPPVIIRLHCYSHPRLNSCMRAITLFLLYANN